MSIKSIPNILTLLRIFMIPVVLIVFYLGNSQLIHIIGFSIFVLAAITDFLDGYLARIWHTQSAIGRFLDPIADKLMIVAVLVMLVDFNRVDIIPAILIICREILVSGLREYLAEVRVSVPVSTLAKWKTFIQIVAISTLLLGSEGFGLDPVPYDYVNIAGRILLWIAAILTLITGYAYFKSGFVHITRNIDS